MLKGLVLSLRNMNNGRYFVKLSYSTRGVFLMLLGGASLVVNIYNFIGAWPYLYSLSLRAEKIVGLWALREAAGRPILMGRYVQERVRFLFLVERVERVWSGYAGE